MANLKRDVEVSCSNTTEYSAYDTQINAVKALFYTLK